MWTIFARSALTFGSAKLDWPKSCSFRLFVGKVIAFLQRGNGGVFTARRRWRFDTSIFRISKVDRPYKWLRNSICRSRDPFLDHLFAPLLDLWNPSNWRSWRHVQNKNAIWGFFGANSHCIYDQSFLINQLRFALLPCTVYLVLMIPRPRKHIGDPP